MTNINKKYYERGLRGLIIRNPPKVFYKYSQWIEPRIMLKPGIKGKIQGEWWSVHTIHGFDIKGEFYDGWDIPLYGHYSSQRHIVNIMQMLMPLSSFFVDIGANIGYYTLLARKTFNLKCLSFEPCKKTYEKLIKNTGQREENFAIGLEDKSVRLYHAKMGSGGNSIYGSGTYETVRMRKLDNYVVPLNSLIKIDVEKAEIKVLEGMTKTLKEKKPILILECHPDNLTAVRSFLLPFGYQLRCLQKYCPNGTILGPDKSTDDYLALPERKRLKEKYTELF